MFVLNYKGIDYLQTYWGRVAFAGRPPVWRNRGHPRGRDPLRVGCWHRRLARNGRAAARAMSALGGKPQGKNNTVGDEAIGCLGQ